MSELSMALAAKAKWWRTKKNDYTLTEAKKILNLSIGHISDLENEKEAFTAKTFLKYHAADPDLFPMKDANFLI